MAEDQDRLKLRNLLLAGAASAPAAPADADYFQGLRERFCPMSIDTDFFCFTNDNEI